MISSLIPERVERKKKKITDIPNLKDTAVEEVKPKVTLNMIQTEKN